jgi:hypothetical protein
VRIEILEDAQEDLVQGVHFYEGREAGLGAYFLDCLFSDIDSLLVYAGVHQVIFGHHRCLSKRFPFAIYYNVEGNGSCASRIGLPQESVVDQETVEGRRLTSRSSRPPEAPAELQR